MTYKTLRNKALKNSTKLITATFHGENWPAPDGHFATAYPIYDGYKIKRDQHIHDGTPVLDNIIDSVKLAAVTTVKREGDNYKLYADSETAPVYEVQAVLYDLLTTLYPNAVAKLPDDGKRYAPVELYDNNTLVAVIMPLKS
jgi:hypothetical protein